MPLKTLADITYGVKTGNDDVFLFDDTDQNTWSINDQFLTPALSDLTHVDGHTLTDEDSTTSLLSLNAYREAQPDNTELKTALERDGYHAVRSYLEYCENEYDITSSPNGGQFDLGTLTPPDIIHPYRIHKQTRVYTNHAELVPTNCANCIDVHPATDETLLLAYLNSTVHAAFLELWGQSEGGGSLEILTGTLRRLPVADTRRFTDTDRTAIIEAFHALTQGEPGARDRLDEAILTALDASIDLATLQDTKRALTNDRLPTT